MPNFKEISCASALNRVSGRFPYKWDLNIYRGCEHGCRYCFAMYSHNYLGSEQYFSDIFIKTNISEQLEKQLSSPSWKREVINIGGVTDSYQPAEARYMLMPDILRLMIKYKNPCIISTKSDLILRDFNLIEELSEITYVGIAATVTCMDEDIRRNIEPRGADSIRRLSVLNEFSKTNVSTGLHFMPIIPFLTDSSENIKAIFSSSRDCGADYIIPEILSLRGTTKSSFFAFVKDCYPEIYAPLFDLYSSDLKRNAYKKELFSMITGYAEEYGLALGSSAVMKEKLSRSYGFQLSLFD